jgi:hypothetical protein
MLTSQEAQVVIGLSSQIFKDDLDLIELADYMELFFTRFLGLFFNLIFIARGKWEARVALEQIAEPLELLFERLMALVVLYIHQELVNDAAETPDVRSLVIAFLHESDFGGSIPS